MGVDITELDPYRRDTIVQKKYKLTPPQPVFKTVQAVHNGIDSAHAAVDRRVVQPVKRIYNHVVNEQGWMKIGVIVGSTDLTRGVTKRLPLSLRIPIPATQAHLHLRSFSSLYTFGVFYGTLYNYYPQKAITAKDHSLASLQMGWSKIKEMSSPSEKDEAEASEAVVMSGLIAAAETRGKDIDIKAFEEGNSGQSDPKDTDLYTTRDETK
jgi:hypothetical protein